jgi:hypothetical protein
MDEDEFAELQELLKDAESCPRLSQWEDEFCDSLRERVLIYKENTTISDKQQAVINRIKAKVYA